MNNEQALEQLIEHHDLAVESINEATRERDDLRRRIIERLIHDDALDCFSINWSRVRRMTRRHK